MLKRTMTYEDYNGDTVTEDFYFNISKAELVEMELSEKMGLYDYMQEIVKTENGPKIVELFKKIVLDAYGKRSEDGRRFIKSQELRDEFASTAAYSDLFVLLATDAGEAAAFVNNAMPKDAREMADKLEEKSGQTVLDVGAPVLEGESEPEKASKTWRDYTKQQLLEMPQEEFQALAGNKPQNMARELLIVAMERKNKT